MAAILRENVIVFWDVRIAEVPLSLFKFLVGQRLKLGIVDQASLAPSPHLKKDVKFVNQQRNLHMSVTYFAPNSSCTLIEGISGDDLKRTLSVTLESQTCVLGFPAVK